MDVICRILMGDTSLKHCMNNGGSSPDLADQGWWFPYLKREPKGFHYRVIKLVKLAGKVYFRVVEKMECWIAKPQIQEEQCSFSIGRGTMDQVYTLNRILQSAWKFTEPIYVFCGLGEGVGSCPSGSTVGVLQEYRVLVPFDTGH